MSEVKKKKKNKSARPAAAPPDPTFLERFFGRRIVRLMRRRNMRFGTWCLGAAAVLSIGVALMGGPVGVSSAGSAFADARMENVTKALGLRLNVVLATGRDQVTRQMLAAHVPYELGASMLKVQPDEVRDSIEKISWVRDVQVRIRWPNTLIVKIEERQPIAVWKIDGQVYVIDADGEPLAAASADDIRNFPQVVGKGANRKIVDILGLLERNPAIGEQVEAAIMVHERRWNLRLRNGVDIQLPDEEAEEALARFAGWYGYSQVLSGDVISVDLRHKDKWFTKLTPGSALMRAMPGQDT